MDTVIAIDDINLDERFSGLRDRLHPTTIDSIVDTLKANGGQWCIEPLTVWLTDDKYVLLSGHHRLIAAKNAGLTTVECVVVSGDYGAALCKAITANRHGVGPASDESLIVNSIKRLMEHNPSIPQSLMASLIGVNPMAISRAMKRGGIQRDANAEIKTAAGITIKRGDRAAARPAPALPAVKQFTADERERIVSDVVAKMSVGGKLSELADKHGVSFFTLKTWVGERAYRPAPAPAPVPEPKPVADDNPRLAEIDELLEYIGHNFPSVSTDGTLTDTVRKCIQLVVAQTTTLVSNMGTAKTKTPEPKTAAAEPTPGYYESSPAYTTVMKKIDGHNGSPGSLNQLLSKNMAARRKSMSADEWKSVVAAATAKNLTT